MKECSIFGCDSKYFAKGMCRNHYYQHLNKYGRNKKCEFENCLIGQFAKGYCKRHYMKLLRTGTPSGITRKCCTVNCNLLTRKPPFCCRCWERIKSGLDHNPLIKHSNAGERNGNWNGGASEYKNHYLMKKNRLIKLNESNYICQICLKNKATEVHHKDFSTDNHSLENLIAICRPCHGLHRSNSLYIKYKNTAKEIASELNISVSKVYKLHRMNELKRLLKSS